MILGVDMASPCPSASVAECLAASGYAFVGRYYTAASDAWKLLTKSEAQMLSAAGLSIVSLFENGGRAFSADIGSADANTALGCAASVGQPAGTPIYFAVDYDATSEDISGDIIPYFRAIQPLLTAKAYAIGVYGSGLVCSSLAGAGLVTYTWLSASTSYSGSDTYTAWTIRQYPTTTVCNGTSVDPDVASDRKYGGFTIPSP